MRKFEVKDRYDLEDYRALIHLLRAPGGCPWDREQTHQSIRRNVLEEAYETAHAIDRGDTDNLREELGDLLMQVLLHADMEEEYGSFDLDDVADAACKKLVFRHPHVFGSATAENSDAVLRTWDQRKMEEKGQKSIADTLRGVAETLPALWRAEKLRKKAVVQPLAEPTGLEQTVCDFRAEPTAETMGDLLLAAAFEAQKAGLDPEMALHAACDRFISRYAEAEMNFADCGES